MYLLNVRKHDSRYSQGWWWFKPPTDLDKSGDGKILVGDGTDINSVELVVM